jgi:hypothetical protein
VNRNEPVTEAEAQRIAKAVLAATVLPSFTIGTQQRVQ